jgi:hypothetical protein
LHYITDCDNVITDCNEAEREDGFLAGGIGKRDKVGFVVSHPSRKNKYAARVGHPAPGVELTTENCELDL